MPKLITGATALLVLAGLYAASLYNYLLFHSLAEVFAVLVAGGIFMVAWNTRRFSANPYLLLVGIAYLFVGLLDLVHTLAYHGMGVFPGYGPNAPTQLWIAARYTESLTLLAAPGLMLRRVRPGLCFLAYGLITAGVLLAIFPLGIFPDCFLPAAGGLTPFKIVSEYVICLILLAAGGLTVARRAHFDPKVLRWLLGSIAVTVLSELAFTTYASVFGPANLLGHYLKIVSFVLIYKAVVETGLTRPYALLFRDLRRQSDRLRVTLGSIGDAVVATDTDGRVAFLNAAFERLTGWSDGEAAGNQAAEVLRLMDARSRSAVACPAAGVLAGGATAGRTEPTLIVRRDGGEVAVDFNGAPIRDFDGRILGAVLVFRDITARLQAEAALRESEERLRLLGDNLPDSAVYQYVHEPDGRVRFLYCSAGIERLNGVSVPTVLNDPGALHRQIPPEHYRRLVEEEARSARELTDVDMEVPMRRPDGETRWMRLHSRPRRMPDGRVVWDGVQTDVTAHKTAEGALRESEQRLRLALEAAFLISFEWDIQRNAVRRTVSTDSALGPTTDEAPGTFEAVRETVHPEDREWFSANVAAALQRENGRYANEFRIVHPDGQVRWLSERGVVERDPQGRPVRLIGLSQDITERKLAEQALNESEQRVRRKLESVLSPEGDLGVLDLADLLDIPETQAIMEEFYAAARIPMSILDVTGRVLVGVGWQEICTRYHRVHPETCRHCLESDTHLSAGLGPGEFRLYKCKNNLWDLATPILVGDRHVGNIFTGQFFFEDETVDRGFFRAQAQKYGFPEQAYLEALDRVPRLSRETVERGIRFFLKLSGMLSRLGYTNVKLARLLAERDRLADSLRESRAKLEAALASMTDAVCIADAQGRFIEVNDAFAAFHRFRDKAECPRTFAAFPDLLDVLLADGTPAPRDRWPVPRALRGESGTNAEFTLRRKDTGAAWAGSYSFGPIRDANGAVVGAVVVARDITEQKRAQAALQRSNEHLKRAQEIAHLGSWEFDLEKNELTWSEEVYRIFGLRPQQFTATYEAFLASVHPEDRRAVDAAYSSSLRDNREAYEMEHRVVRPDGEIRHVHEKCGHQRDAAGRIVRSVGMVHDITEKHQAQEALRRSNRELEQFAYVASHDLQEPLRAVVGFLQLLESRYGDRIDAKGRHYIERAVKAGHRMQTLIRELLTLSRVSTREAVFAPADLNAIVRNVAETLEPAAGEKRAEIVCGHLPTLAVDGNQIQSLFQNLLGNAVKYNTSPAPRIEIGCREGDTHWQFFVKDNGIGIAPEFHERIFMVFQRLHTDREYPGTGLGLALCQKIVERHGGRIWVDSRPPEGATFHFTLPTRR